MAAEQTLRDVLRRAAPEHGWDEASIRVAPISSGGANYSSTLFLASAAAGARQDRLFAKVAIMGEQVREQVGAQFYEVEKYIYTDLKDIYQGLEDKHQVPKEDRMNYPKMYAASTEPLKETVVLEDLQASGFGSFDRLKPVSWEYAARAMTELAKLHALSMAFAEEDPEGFAKAAEYLKYKVPAQTPEAMEGFKMFLQAAFVSAREEYLPYLQRMLATVDPEAFAKYNLPVSKPVLIHGDYRVSNLLHRRRNGKLEIIPIDYQTVHTGCPATDVLYFTFLGTDSEFRKLHWKHLLDHYHKELGASLKRLGLDINTVYPRKDFDGDLKEMLPGTLLIVALVLPLVLVDEDDAPDLAKGLETMAMKPSASYPERLNGCIEDLISWGAL